METFFGVTDPLCGEFTGHRWIPTQRPVTRRFDVFFGLRLNKRLGKQSWCWWFEMPLRSLWCHCDVFHLIDLSLVEQHTNYTPQFDRCLLVGHCYQGPLSIWIPHIIYIHQWHHWFIFCSNTDLKDMKIICCNWWCNLCMFLMKLRMDLFILSFRTANVPINTYA